MRTQLWVQLWATGDYSDVQSVTSGRFKLVVRERRMRARRDATETPDGESVQPESPARLAVTHRLAVRENSDRNPTP